LDISGTDVYGRNALSDILPVVAKYFMKHMRLTNARTKIPWYDICKQMMAYMTT